MHFNFCLCFNNGYAMTVNFQVTTAILKHKKPGFLFLIPGRRVLGASNRIPTKRYTTTKIFTAVCGQSGGGLVHG